MKKFQYTINACFWCVAIAQLTAACGQDDDSRTQVSQHEPATISLTCGIAQPAATRAWADQYSNSLPSGAQVDVFLYDEEERDISTCQPPDKGVTLTGPAQWVYKTNGSVDPATMRSQLTQTDPKVSGTVFTPKIPFKSGSSSDEVEYIDIFAVFPHTAGINPSTASYTFNVNTNQTTQANVNNSDLLTSDFASITSAEARSVNLELKHRMAKILVVFQADGDLTASNMPANESTITVNNVKTQVTIDPQEGSVETSGSTSNVTATVGEPFFLPPQTIAKGQTFLTFNLRNSDGTTTGIRNVTFAPTEAITLRGDVYYQLTVTMSVTNVRLTTVIKNWTFETLNFDKIIL